MRTGCRNPWIGGLWHDCLPGSKGVQLKVIQSRTGEHLGKRCGLGLYAGRRCTLGTAKSNCTNYVNWRRNRIEDRPWNKMGNLVLGLLRMVLDENPEKRFTVERIRNDPWFKKDFSYDE